MRVGGSLELNQNHIKDIIGVQAIQPCPLHWLNHWSVAAMARSAQLMYSMDRKPGQKGGRMGKSKKLNRLIF